MVIKSLEIKNFRNYRELNISFDKGTNILYGENAQGKTNILESIYVSGTTKSHRGSKDGEMISFEENEAHIHTVIEKKDTEHQIDFHLKKNNAKGIAVDKMPLRRARDIFGILNVVFFSPEDLDIVKSGPLRRRHFMDMELSQIDKIYLDDITNYNRVLKQRNQLLKDIFFRPDLEKTLFVWNEQMVIFGTKIIERRRQFLSELNDVVTDIHDKISGGKERLVLTYEPSCEEEKLKEELEKSNEKDKKTGMTSYGPHRDDILFYLNGKDIRKFGSQGQQRTLALSLKLAEIELIRKAVKEPPVLLLDDVLSELDYKRQNYLLDNIQNIQTIITCTGLDELIKSRFHLDKVYFIKNGEVREKEKSYE